jgi:hypothetical protein
LVVPRRTLSDHVVIVEWSARSRRHCRDLAGSRRLGGSGRVLIDAARRLRKRFTAATRFEQMGVRNPANPCC